MPYVSNKEINKIRKLATEHFMALKNYQEIQSTEGPLPPDLEALRHYHRGGQFTAMIALQAVTKDTWISKLRTRIGNLRDDLLPH